MIETSMNIFDLAVLVIVGLSALLSFFRGFAREILSLGAWIIASVITLYTFPTVAQWIEPQVKSATVASGLASMGVFFVSLIVLNIITGTMVKFIKPGSEVGAIDNIVGLVFGAARGTLIVAIAYFMMTLVLAEKDYPEWVKQSHSRPYVAKAANWVASAAPDYLSAMSGSASEREEKLEKAKEKTKARAEKLREATDDLPSFEDLQRRVRAENEGN